MKKNIKKIIVGMFAFALFFSAQSVFAATWNGDAKDCPSINVANLTTGTGWNDPCWTGTNISANPGDIVNVRIYYHNTGTTTAQNTKVYLDADLSSSTSHRFTGRITSDQGNLSFSPVYITTKSAQSLSFGTVKWTTENIKDTPTSLLNGQDGSEILDEGLYIGSIAPGWPTQGSLVISFKVSNNTTPEEECFISSFNASPSSINKGDSSNLSWSTKGCDYIYIENIGQVSSSGNRTVYPSSTTTYSIKASKEPVQSSSVITKTTQVVVNNVVEPNECVINYLNASPSSITKNQSSVISWSTSNCTEVVIEGIGSYGLSKSGYQTVWPTSTKTYTMTAYSQTGANKTRNVTVYVDGSSSSNSCRIDSFTASDTRIDEGDETELRWRTTGCDRVKISDIGTVDEDGEETVEPDEDTTYTLTAYDEDGNYTKDTVKIYVDGDNDDDDDDEEDGKCKIDSFKASDTYIDQGDYTKLTWKTTDCDSVSISNIGRVPEDGSEIVYPYNTVIYILKAYGNDNTDTDTLKINVGNDSEYRYNTSVVTTVATNVSQNSASLNGLLTNSGSSNQSVFFEYGTTVNLGSRTNAKTVSGNANFTEYVSGLSANTIYFFQAVASGSNGVSRGAIEVFRTLGYSTGSSNSTTTRINQGTTISGSASPVMLDIENKYQTLNRGDVVEYTVYYKNISRSTLRDPMIQVYIPEGITVINSSAGTYSNDDRTLSVPIQDLKSQEEGVIYIQAKVDSIDSSKAQIVTTAVLIYTNSNQAQENAMAYVLNNPGSTTNMLGASALLGGFLGLSLIGWLLLILFILLIVLIARTYYNKEPVQTQK